MNELPCSGPTYHSASRRLRGRKVLCSKLMVGRSWVFFCRFLVEFMVVIGVFCSRVFLDFVESFVNFGLKEITQSMCVDCHI